MRRNDIYRWVDSFLEASVSKHLENFPRVEEYTPPPLEARRERQAPVAAELW